MSTFRGQRHPSIVHALAALLAGVGAQSSVRGIRSDGKAEKTPRLDGELKREVAPAHIQQARINRADAKRQYRRWRNLTTA